MPHVGQPSQSSVVGVVIDIDREAVRVLDQESAWAGNPLLLIRIETSSPPLGVAEVLVIQPVDGGVACGQHRTKEEADRLYRKFDIQPGDRLELKLELDVDTVCGRLRPCDGLETEMWLAADFEKVDGAA